MVFPRAEKPKLYLSIFFALAAFSFLNCQCSSEGRSQEVPDDTDSSLDSDVDIDTDADSDTEVDTSAPLKTLSLDWLDCITDDTNVNMNSATSIVSSEETSFYVGGEYHGGEVGDSYLLQYNTSGVRTKTFSYYEIEDGAPQNIVGVRGLAFDSEGLLYATGRVTGPVVLENDSIEGVEVQSISSGGSDVLVVQIQPTLGPAWARVSGGWESPDVGQDIIVDSEERPVISGLFTTPGVFDLDGSNETWLPIPPGHEASLNVFSAKYLNDGSLLWARQDGGREKDAAYGIAEDGDGGIFLAGYCGGWNGEKPVFGDGEVNETSVTVNGFSDYFLAKYGTNGDFLWVQAAGGKTTNVDLARDIGINGNGSAVIVGEYSGEIVINDGMTTEVCLETALKPNGFLASYQSSGELEWAQWYGSLEEDEARAISINENEIYVLGVVRGKAVFGKGQENQSVLPCYSGQMYIAKYLTDGSLEWVAGIYDSMGDIAYDDNYVRPNDIYYLNGKLIVAGEFYGTAGLGLDEDSIPQYCVAEHGGAFVAQYSI